ncbi:MAG TPA: STAS domain-containing protein [Anaerolineales bacterium]|nr:STAS domain-containing protein [Anaerolineales bacterium]
MEITIALRQAKEPVAIMHIKGEINATNFVEVVAKAREIYNNPARYLVIDLSEVTNITSTGLVAIHKIALLYSGVPHEVEPHENPDFTHSSNARKYVRLLNPQPAVDAALEQSGLKLFFKVFDDLEKAIRSF